MYQILFNPEHDSGSVTFRLPASKSITNRLLLLKYIYPSAPEIANMSESSDSRILQNALRALGTGETDIDVQDCGTAMRFLIPVLAATPGQYVLRGTPRMHQRPVKDLVEGLRQIGAQIEYTNLEGFPPLAIRGFNLPGGQIIMDGSISSQFISALMMASPLMQSKLEVFLHTGITSIPYIQMTSELMLQCGIPAGTFDIYLSESLIRENDINTLIPDKKYLRNECIEVEADWSAASYAYALSATGVLKELFIPNLRLDSVQGDAKVAAIYNQFGVKTVESSDGIYLRYTGAHDDSINFNGLHHPDLAPTIAVSAAILGIPVTLSNLGNLVHKESNRLLALHVAINGIFPGGCLMEGDTLQIDTAGIKPVTDYEMDTLKDHRLAMAFAIFATRFPIKLTDIKVVRKSFPEFWDQLKSCGFEAISVT